jgi:hypothetical protein
VEYVLALIDEMLASAQLSITFLFLVEENYSSASLSHWVNKLFMLHC